MALIDKILCVDNLYHFQVVIIVTLIFTSFSLTFFYEYFL